MNMITIRLKREWNILVVLATDPSPPLKVQVLYTYENDNIVGKY